MSCFSALISPVQRLVEKKIGQHQVAENGHSHGIGEVVSSFVAFLLISSEIWTLKIFLHNTTLWTVPRTNESVTPTHSIFIALAH